MDWVRKRGREREWRSIEGRSSGRGISIAESGGSQFWIFESAQLSKSIGN